MSAKTSRMVVLPPPHTHTSNQQTNTHHVKSVNKARVNSTLSLELCGISDDFLVFYFVSFHSKIDETFIHTNPLKMFPSNYDGLDDPSGGVPCTVDICRP